MNLLNSVFYGLAFLLMLGWIVGFFVYSTGTFIDLVLLVVFDMVLLNLLKRRPPHRERLRPG